MLKFHPMVFVLFGFICHALRGAAECAVLAPATCEQSHEIGDLEFCVQHKRTSLVQMVLEQKRYSTDEIHKCYIRATKNDDLPTFELLYAKTATPREYLADIKSDYRYIKLIKYAAKHSLSITKFLLSPGGQFAEAVTQTYGLNMTLLHWSAKHNPNPATTEYLLQAGADPNARNEGGLTPVHYAACSTYLGHLDFLLLKGGNPNACDRTHRSPLHLAAGLNLIHNLKRLLEAGADVHIKDDQGKTPLAYARKYNYALIEQTLVAAEDRQGTASIW